jgi:hypothetical protein
MPLPADAAADPGFGITLSIFPQVEMACSAVCMKPQRYVDTSGVIQASLAVTSGGAWSALGVRAPSDAAAHPDVWLGSLTCGELACLAEGTYQNAAGHGVHALWLVAST